MSNKPGPDSGKKDVIRVLIVDDISEARENLKKLLSFEPDIEVVGTASNGREGVDLAKELQPNIILMDINMPDMDGITATELISEAVPNAAVVMMSVQSEGDYMQRAMLAGARYFLTKPTPAEELYGVVRGVHSKNKARGVIEAPPSDRGSRRRRPDDDFEDLDDGQRRAQVVVVYSPQGGSGKTTIATNLAAGLMSEGTKVLLIDADLQFGDVGIFLNLKAPTTIVDLAKDAEEDLDMDLVENVLVAHETGLKVMLAPLRPEDAETVDVAHIPPLIEKLRPLFHFIVVDTASPLNDLALALFDIADRILLVVNPTLPSVKNVRAILNVMDALQYPEGKAQLVMNRVSAELEKAKVLPTVQQLEGSLKRKALGAIPVDERRVLAALNRGTPVIARDRNLSPAKEIVALAEALRASFAPLREESSAGSQDSKQSSSRLGRLFGSSA